MDFSTEEKKTSVFGRTKTFVGEVVIVRKSSHLGRLENYLLSVITYVAMCWCLTFLLVTMVLKALRSGGVELSQQVILAFLVIISAVLFFFSGLLLLVEFHDKAGEWAIESSEKKNKPRNYLNV